MTVLVLGAEDKIGSILGFNLLADLKTQEELPSSDLPPSAYPAPAKATAWKLPAAEKPARGGCAAERAGDSWVSAARARANISIHAVAATAAAAAGPHALSSPNTPSLRAANNIVALRHMSVSCGHRLE